MDFDHAYRRYKIYALRNQQRKENEQEVTRVDSAITAPYNSFTGVTLQKGAALSTEMENYRRRVIALLNFFDSIAPRWWDQLHRFNGRLVKRPSRSAELIVKLQARLKARLTRLTPRMVIPAAAAVVTIEESDIVSVLPQNLLHLRGQPANRRSKLGKFENVQETLRLAYSIARRLGEVERLKQQLILYAVEWINADGRDFSLRAQRLALLTKNIKYCLIERFKGVQALITHYYRRRSSNNLDDGGSAPPMGVEVDSKSRLMHAFCEVTAACISTTSMEILRVMANADLTLATDPAFTTDFIDYYSPNILPMSTYTLASVTTDVNKQEGIVPLERAKRSMTENSTDDIRHEESVLSREQINPTTLTDQHINSKQSSMLSRTPGVQPHNRLKKSGTPNSFNPSISFGEAEEEDEELITLPDINSYKLRRSDSESRRKRETAQFITKLLALQGSKSSVENDVKSLGSQNPLPSLKHTSSSTALPSTLLFRPSSLEDNQGNFVTRANSTLSDENT
ncbi:hypothetical protein EGR_03138 [Echinococcus granulosus]|uniref:DUF5738 domain-containing protein n=1 Tax=Echinococcus granulosus TaxID=6210 RepID=W6UUS1_ECHGR|nr:hypothetical protein EGR_03138 [Echinococcus granulosus]EUB62117.1 hypothetical protein EGR_03138 [Echinococcus granulosus]